MFGIFILFCFLATVATIMGTIFTLATWSDHNRFPRGVYAFLIGSWMKFIKRDNIATVLAGIINLDKNCTECSVASYSDQFTIKQLRCTISVKSYGRLEISIADDRGCNSNYTASSYDDYLIYRAITSWKARANENTLKNTTSKNANIIQSRLTDDYKDRLRLINRK